MFFENAWDSQLSKSIRKDTTGSKIRVSTNSSHKELVAEVDEYELPSMYGGLCDCKASCIYSEKGPWTEVENMVNYKNPQPDSEDSDGEGNGQNLKDLNAMLGGMNLGSQKPNFGKLVDKSLPPKKQKDPMKNQFFGESEEFKMQEDDDDCIDLLKEKEKSKDIEEFYQ